MGDAESTDLVIVTQSISAGSVHPATNQDFPLTLMPETPIIIRV